MQLAACEWRAARTCERVCVVFVCVRARARVCVCVCVCVCACVGDGGGGGGGACVCDVLYWNKTHVSVCAREGKDAHTAAEERRVLLAEYRNELRVVLLQGTGLLLRHVAQPAPLQLIALLAAATATWRGQSDSSATAWPPLQHGVQSAMKRRECAARKGVDGGLAGEGACRDHSAGWCSEAAAPLAVRAKIMGRDWM